MATKQFQNIAQTIYISESFVETRGVPKLHWTIRLHNYPGFVLFLNACRWQINCVAALLREKR